MWTSYLQIETGELVLMVSSVSLIIIMVIVVTSNFWLIILHKD